MTSLDMRSERFMGRFGGKNWRLILVNEIMRKSKIIKMSAVEVQKRFFELLDKIVSRELVRVEIELNGIVVAQITSVFP